MMPMWSPILTPDVHLLSGPRPLLRQFAQEVTHRTLHTDGRTVLWCDGDHGFNPYHFAELNLRNGYAAGEGANRILVKRCMTAFQWDTVLDQQLADKLAETPTSLVVAAPYDALFRHPELQDWEQEDHLTYSVAHLNHLATQYAVPILAFVDMDHLWRSHPTLAAIIYQAFQDRWLIERPGGRWRLVHERTRDVLDPSLRRKVTLLDFLPEDPVVVPPTPTRRSKQPLPPM